MMLSFQHCNEPLKVGSYVFTVICVLENLPSGQHSYLPVFPGTPVWLIKEDIEQRIGETSETEKGKRKRGNFSAGFQHRMLRIPWTTVYIQETVTHSPHNQAPCPPAYLQPEAGSHH
ncbi:rCG59791 [Rattus norvegicus]|uniref:RCG59791 n=1 Tax=Rattus norvegicus TaxID=10116 RepID=A6HRM8_RAT|nr:rCG59791 [Rattus norvegicus]